MRLLIARHAEDIGAPNNDKSRKLTQLGHKQSELLGQVLKEFHPEVILCSSLKRSIQTAELANYNLGVPIVSHNIFDEMQQGEIKSDRSNSGYQSSKDTFDGGENYASLNERVKDGWNLINVEYSHNDRLALISHGRYMTYFIGLLLGHQPDGFNLAIANGSYVIFEITKDFRPQLVLPVAGEKYI